MDVQNLLKGIINIYECVAEGKGGEGMCNIYECVAEGRGGEGICKIY